MTVFLTVLERRIVLRRICMGVAIKQLCNRRLTLLPETSYRLAQCRCGTGQETRNKQDEKAVHAGERIRTVRKQEDCRKGQTEVLECALNWRNVALTLKIPAAGILSVMP
jgi:hypothetical protein